MNVLIKRVERMQSFNKHNFSKKTIKETILFSLSKHTKQDHSLLHENILFLSKISKVTLKQISQRRSLIFLYFNKKHVKLI